jgi:hypothetical protein
MPNGVQVSLEEFDVAFQLTAVPTCKKDQCVLEEIWMCYGRNNAGFPSHQIKCPAGKLTHIVNYYIMHATTLHLLQSRLLRVRGGWWCKRPSGGGGNIGHLSCDSKACCLIICLNDLLSCSSGSSPAGCSGKTLQAFLKDFIQWICLSAGTLASNTCLKHGCSHIEIPAYPDVPELLSPTAAAAI